MSDTAAAWAGWLLDIDASKIPAGSTLEVAWANWPTGWGATACTLSAIAGLVALASYYRKETGDLNGVKRVLMLVLRAAVLALVAAVCLRPVLIAKRTIHKPARFVILVDSSASMSRADKLLPEADAAALADALGTTVTELRKTPRMELALRLLEREHGRLPAELARASSVEIFRFDSGLTEMASLPTTKVAGAANGNGTGSTGSGSGSGSDLSLPRLASDELYGRATHLGGAVLELLSRFEGEPIAGILVVGDGKSNGGPDVAAAASVARAKKIPIWAVAIGDPHRPKNLELRSVASPPAVFQSSRDAFGVSAEIFHQGYEGLATRVTLYRVEGEQATEIESQPVELKGEGESIVASFKLMPKQLGRFAYKIAVDAIPNEEQTRDNERSFEVEVRDSWAKVLFVAGGPSFEYRILRNYLARESNIELHQWLQSADESWNVAQNRWNWGAARVRKANELHAAGETGRAVELLSKVIVARTPSWVGTAEDLLKKWGASAVETEIGDREWLSKLELQDPKLIDLYDVIVMLDVDGHDFERPVFEQLRRFVEERGGGMLFVAGEKHTLPLLSASAAQPLLEMLPVQPNLDLAQERAGAGRTYAAEYRPTLASEGTAHPLTALLPTDPERNRGLWEALPAMYWSFPIARAKSHARVLLRHSSPDENTSDGQPAPVAAIHHFGPGQVLWLGFDETYRWRGQAEEIYQLFWTQTVRHLTTGKLLSGRLRARFVLQRASFDVGEPVRLQVSAQESDLSTPLAEAELSVEVSGPQLERRLTLQPIVGRPGWYEGVFNAPRPGAYKLSLEGFREREHEPITLEILPSQRELREPLLDRGTLARMCAVAPTADPGKPGGAAPADGKPVAAGGLVDPRLLLELPGVVPDASITLEEPQPPIELWATPLVLALVAAFLTAEWLLRKFANLL